MFNVYVKILPPAQFFKFNFPSIEINTRTHADSTYKLKVSVRVLELCRNHLSINKIASAFSMDKIKLYCDSNCKLI